VIGLRESVKRPDNSRNVTLHEDPGNQPYLSQLCSRGSRLRAIRQAGHPDVRR
jgi:hypothetical protein